MYRDTVEIYSDRTNAIVLRHPGRKYPGVLVQGDALYQLFQQADHACNAARDQLDARGHAPLIELRDHLLTWLDHYRTVLQEHEIHAPFVDPRD